MAQSKLELILELKDRMKTGISKAREHLRGSVKDMKGRITDLKRHHAQALSAMKDEIPGLARGIEMLRNPYIIAAAAAVGFLAVSGQAAMVTARFNREFLNIKQLNLDKSKEQLTDYRKLVLDTSFQDGLDPIKTSQAFYDVQSATGLFGDAVADVVGKVGRFSIATGADMTDSINSTVKAMKAFRLGVNDIDGLLQSNAKTVQLGITTFDQLAKVQTEYAGAAASAGQSVDTANKVFAAFTSISGNSQLAANKVKTAFEGLTQANTIKGLQGIGVQMFDVNNNLLGADKIIGQLVPKLNQMNDQQFVELRNGIGGPHGLQDLLNQLRADGDGVLQIFDKFDKVDFDIDQALKNAKGDFMVLKDIVGNRLNVVMTELGESILPTLARGLDMANNGIVWFRQNRDLVKESLMAGIAVLTAFKFQSIVSFAAATLSAFSFQGALTAIRTAFFSIPIVGWIAAAVSGFILLYRHSDIFRATIDGVLNVFKEMLPIALALGKVVAGVASGNFGAITSGIAEARAAFADFDLTGAYERGYNASMRKTREQSNTSMDAEAEASPDGGGSPTGGTPTPTANNSVSGAAPAQPVRNITVNVEAIHKGDNVLHSQEVNGSMDLSEFSRMMEEYALRLLRNVETTF